MQQICTWITQRLIINEIIEQTDQEIYQYGLYLAFILAINIVSALFISYLLDMVFYGLLFLISFIPLRSFTGGYHAKNQRNCYFVGLWIITSVLILTKFLPWTSTSCLILISIADLIIVLLAPIEDSHKRLSISERKVYKIFVLVILGTENVITALMFYLYYRAAAVVLTLSFVITGILLLVSVAKQQLKTP